MSLKTRLDPRSKDNNKFYIKNSDGFIVAIVKMLGDKGGTLEIATDDNFHIEKPNGWSSK